MSGHSFRPSIARVQNSQKIFTSTKTNATIRDLEEEEGELEEKEGTVVSIKRDLINGAGWTVKDEEGQTYICSCASSMYEVPETVERGGILYPTDTVEVVFTINPVLRINTIKEIKSLGEETEKVDISQWTHGDEATTIIAKPKSALSISDGFIKLDYNNDNKVLADPDGVKTQGAKTSIETKKLAINSSEITINDKSFNNVLTDNILNISNAHETQTIDAPNGYITLDSSNNIMQMDVNADNLQGYGVIGSIKNQKLIPVKELSQRLLTDGDDVEVITIDNDGIIRICPFEKDNVQCEVINNNYTRNIQSLTSWITPQIGARNYLKVIVKKTCDNCDRWDNTEREFINYCPSCGNWNCLSDTSTSRIKCTRCSVTYCENCGHSISAPLVRLRDYSDNKIIGYGTNCKDCKGHIEPQTTKYYVDYCPNCNTWGQLIRDEYNEDDDVINVLSCLGCGSRYCCSCGIDRENRGLTLTDAPQQYTAFKEAYRRLKYLQG